MAGASVSSGRWIIDYGLGAGNEPGDPPDCCRVGLWRGGLGLAYLLPALSAAGASIAWPCFVSTSRSSNPACGSPAPGSRTRTHAFAHGKLFVRALRLISPNLGYRPDCC